jgi:hypothetical protein
MPDPLDPAFTSQNPIVAAAERIRARRELGKLIDDTAQTGGAFDDTEAALRAFAANLAEGSKRLNSILGAARGVKVIVLEKPLRVRLRFGEKRASFDLDEVNQLVAISGLNLDGHYQFIPDAATPALINISVISSAAGYGDALTASGVLKLIAQDAELPRPSHLDRSGPISL